MTKKYSVTKSILGAFRQAIVKKHGGWHGVSRREWEGAISDRCEVIEAQLEKLANNPNYDFEEDVDFDPVGQHKVLVSIEVDEELAARFSNLILEKYGKRHGVVYREMNMTLHARTEKLMGKVGVMF